MSEFKDWLEWLTGSQTAEPTYPALGSVPVEEARLTLDQVFDEFMQIAERWNDEHAPIEDDKDNPFLDLAKEMLERKLKEDPPPVRAVCITTGVGKTERVIAMLARSSWRDGQPAIGDRGSTWYRRFG
jgi:hypothetical protein